MSSEAPQILQPTASERSKRFAPQTVALVGVICALIGWSAFSLATSEPEQEIHCKQPAWDFGTIQTEDRADTLKHDFHIENRGKEIVRIEELKTNCGCIVADDHPREIPANGSVTIPVSIRVPATPGPVQKQITIKFKGSKYAEMTLVVQGFIGRKTATYLLPGSIQFGKLLKGESRESTIRIARFDAMPLQIISAIPRSDSIEVTHIKSGNEHQSFVELGIRLTSAALPPGDFNSVIDVFTDCEATPNIEVQVAAGISNRSTGLVDTLMISNLQFDNPIEKSLVAEGQVAPQIERIMLKGPDCIQLTTDSAANPSSESSIPPRVSISRTNQNSSSRVIHSKLIVQLAKEDQPIEIPVVVLLSQ